MCSLKCHVRASGFRPGCPGTAINEPHWETIDLRRSSRRGNKKHWTIHHFLCGSPETVHKSMKINHVNIKSFQVPCMFFPCISYKNRVAAFGSNRNITAQPLQLWSQFNRLFNSRDAFWSMHQKLNVEWCDPRRCSYHLLWRPQFRIVKEKNGFPSEN